MAHFLEVWITVTIVKKDFDISLSAILYTPTHHPISYKVTVTGKYFDLALSNKTYRKIPLTKKRQAGEMGAELRVGKATPRTGALKFLSSTISALYTLRCQESHEARICTR